MEDDITAMGDNVTAKEVDALYEKLGRDAQSAGNHLNPGVGLTKQLVRGLLVNKKRYGYPACPCRLASGVKEDDLDIICSCDYRDPDLSEYGACYCALYVSQAVVDGEQKVGPIPERRPPPAKRKKATSKPMLGGISLLPVPIWRCRVCGYLCAREGPPEVCPICKAKKERFERFV